MFFFVRSAFLLFMVLLFVGCSSEEDALEPGTVGPAGLRAANNSTIPGVSDVPMEMQSRVEAFAFTDGTSIRLGNSATPPSGFRALENATVTVNNPDLTVVAKALPVTTETDKTGHFLLSNVLSGQRELQIGSLTRPFTAIGGATVQLGETAVTRSQATALVKQRIALLGTDVLPDPAQFFLLSPNNPVPAGVKVAPQLKTDDNDNPDPSLVQTLSGPKWFFYLDPKPFAPFQHPVVYYFVDPATGELTEASRRWWPTLNGLSYYYTDGLNLDSPDLLQGPTFPAAPNRVKQAAAALARHAGDVNSAHTFVMVLCGSADDGTDSDLDHLATRYFSTVAGQWYPDLSRFLSYNSVEHDDPNPLQVALDQFAFICDEAQEEDLVVIYLGGHVGSDTLGALQLYKTRGKPLSAWAVLRATPVLDNVGMQLRDLDFSKLKAKHVIIDMEYCHSGAQIQRVLTPTGDGHFARGELREPGFYNTNLVDDAERDALILTAADASHDSESIPDSSLRNFAYPGGFFSNALFQYLEEVHPLGNQGRLLFHSELLGNVEFDDFMAAAVFAGRRAARLAMKGENPQVLYHPPEADKRFAGSFQLTSPGSDSASQGFTFESAGNLSLTLHSLVADGQTSSKRAVITGVQIRTGANLQAGTDDAVGIVNATVLPADPGGLLKINGTIQFVTKRTNGIFRHPFQGLISLDKKTIAADFTGPGDSGSFQLKEQEAGNATIVSVSPTHARPGDTIQIQGTHLGGIAANVTLAGGSLEVPHGDDESIQVVLPRTAASGDLQVGNATFPFTVDTPAVNSAAITAINPPTGAAGTLVTISGQNLGGLRLSSVSFNTLPAVVVAGDNESLQVLAPGARTGLATVAVTNLAAPGDAISTLFSGGVLAKAVWNLAISPDLSTQLPDDGLYASPRYDVVHADFSGGTVVVGASDPRAASFVNEVSAHTSFRFSGHVNSGRSGNSYAVLFNGFAAGAPQGTLFFSCGADPPFDPNGHAGIFTRVTPDEFILPNNSALVFLYDRTFFTGTVGRNSVGSGQLETNLHGPDTRIDVTLHNP